MSTGPKTNPKHPPAAPAQPDPPAQVRPIPQRVEDRPTEDDLARQALGGPKGSPELPPAPLTKTEEEQTFPNDDPGHVA
jgi:hypothetical protein